MTKAETADPARRLADKRATYLSLPPLDTKQRYTLAEATLYLRQSLAQTYNHIAAGRLHVIKVGARTYVHGSEIARASADPVAA